jgi:hypothetical protein
MLGPEGANALRAHAPSHPALQQLDALEVLQSSSGIDRLRETELLSELADYFLDFRTWPRSATQDDFWGFLVDGAGRERVRRNVRSAEQYEDTLAEVETWAALLREGLAVTLIEEDNRPDLQIQNDGQTLWAEVKSVRLGTAPRNAGNSVTKANQQLRQADPDHSGILFVRISRAAHRASFDDRVPDDVAPYVEEIRREMSGNHNRSVGIAVVSWVDFFILDDGRGRALHAFRRRSIVLRHAAPRSTPPVSEGNLDLGRTFTISIGYPQLPDDMAIPTLPPLSAGRIVVTTLFRDMNEFRYGIRPQHAIEAMAAPDIVEHMGPVTLALRRVPAAGYSLLLIAGEREGETQIMMGFRLYDATGMTAATPTAVLNRMLEACGVPTRLGGRVALLHPQATVDEMRLETAESSSDRGFMHAAVLRRADGRLEISCAFAVDSERYERTMASPV